MRLLHSSLARTLLTLAISGCFEGTGSGLTGVNNQGGGGVNGSAPVLSFFAQPNTANAGQVMSAVQIVASDSTGRADTTFTGSISVALASNPTGAALSGTLTRRASLGIATFGDLRVDRAGTYTLRASTSGATSVTSAAFTITTSTTP